MNSELDRWLRQHRAEIEVQWLAMAGELPAYAAPAEERLSYWYPLLHALTEDLDAAFRFADTTEDPAKHSGRVMVALHVA